MPVTEKLLRNPWIWSFFFGSLVSWIFSTRVERPKIDLRLELQAQILSGQALEPYRFRILFPWLAQSSTDALEFFGLETYWAHLIAFLFLNTLFLSFTFRIVWDIASDLPRTYRVLALAILAGAWNVALYDHFYQPWSVAEGTFVALAFWLVLREKLSAIPLVVILATLNRDTGVLIPLSVALFIWFSKKPIPRHAVFWLLCAQVTSLAVFVFLRLALGSNDVVNTLDQILLMNLSTTGLAYLAINLALMLGPMLLLILSPVARASLRPWLLSFSPQFLLILLFGVWLEVRLFIPYLFFAPLALATYLSIQDRSNHHEN